MRLCISQVHINSHRTFGFRSLCNYLFAPPRSLQYCERVDVLLLPVNLVNPNRLGHACFFLDSLELFNAGACKVTAISTALIHSFNLNYLYMYLYIPVLHKGHLDAKIIIKRQLESENFPHLHRLNSSGRNPSSHAPRLARNTVRSSQSNHL